MAFDFSTGLANKILASGFADAFDGGTARINIYDGTRPAVGGAISGPVLLATLVPGSDVFGTPASRQVAANAITSDASADNTGTPDFFVLYRTGDTALSSPAAVGDYRMTGTVSVNGGGGDMDLTIAGGGSSIVAGGAVGLSSLVVLIP